MSFSLKTISWNVGLCFGRISQHGTMISWCTALGVCFGGFIRKPPCTFDKTSYNINEYNNAQYHKIVIIIKLPNNKNYKINYHLIS